MFNYGLLASGAMLIAATALAGEPAAVPYPEGYRHWHHVKSMVIQKGHPLFDTFGGIHHLYANAKATEGYRTGHFPDGAVIVFDLLDAQTTGDDAIVEGARKVVGVMQKDSMNYADTGGWGFEGFKGDSKTERAVGTKAAEACFGCHTARVNAGYVFSETRR